MRKITSLIALLLIAVAGWAQNITAYAMTGYGDPLTVDQLKALAGTGKRVALVAVSNTAANDAPRCDHWFDFTFTHNGTLTEAKLFTIEESTTTSGYYNLFRATDGLSPMSNASGNFSATPLDLNVKSRTAGDHEPLFTGDNSISLDNAAGNHYNASGMEFRGGTGGWSAYGFYGPIYKVTVNCYNKDDNSLIQTVESYGVNGTVVNAPAIELYTLDGTYSATVSDADVTLDAYYAPVVTTDVTYNLLFEGNVKKTEVVASAIGSAPELPASFNLPYATYTFDVTEITAATTEVNVTVTFALPFTTSTDFASAKWYYLQQQKTYGYYNYTDSSNAGKWSTSNGKTDNYQWAFIGNVIDGFKVINKGSGDGLYMKDAAAITMDATGTVWSIEKISDTHFCLYNDAEVIGDGKYVNNRKEGMGKWNDNSAGSQMWVTEVPADPYYDEIIALANPFVEAAKDGYFQLASSGTAVDAFNAALSTIETNHTNGTVSTQADYDNIVSLLNNAIVYPETGYYRIKSSGSRTGATYMSYKSNISLWYGDSRNGLFTVSESNMPTDLSTVLFLDKQADGTYKISSQGMNLQNQTTNDTAFPMTTAEGANFTFRIYEPGVVAITNDFATQGYLHESAWGENVAGVVRWTFASNASHWTVEDADVATLALNEIDGKSYGTAYLPFDAYFLSGVKAYAVKVNGNYATYTEIAGNEFPAGTGVLLISEEGNTSVSVYPTASGVAAVADNDLTGHYLAGTVADALVLNKNASNVVGFYTLDASATLAANRAYLPASALGTGVRSLVLTEGTTGISSLLNAENNGTAYDLQGRRVMNAQKGLYILRSAEGRLQGKNGKKVLVK